MNKQIWLSAFVCLLLFAGCSRLDKGKSQSNRHSIPENVLMDFFEACASMEKDMIDSLSIVEEYPLVTDWKIRRIAESSEHLSVSEISDTIDALNFRLVQTNTRIHLLEDSLKSTGLVGASDLTALYQRYKQAELNWEEAELAKINRKLSADSKKLEELKKQKDELFKQYQKAQNKFSNEDIFREEEFNSQIESHKDKYDKYLVSRDEFSRILMAMYKSNIHDIKSSEPTCSISAYVDLQIPSKLGIILNKKAKIELVSTSCDNSKSVWIILNIEYLGE